MNEEQALTMIVLAEKAQALTQAIHEFTLADSCLDTNVLNMDDATKVLEMREILRYHNTCSSLICILSDVLTELLSSLESVR